MSRLWTKSRVPEELRLAHCSYRRRVDYQSIVRLAANEDRPPVTKDTKGQRKVDSEKLNLAYHPSPQNLLDRPHIPSLEQQAPQVGEQAKPSAPTQVPSTVTTPVCHGGTTSVAVPWDTAHAGNSQKRANADIFIFNCPKRCAMPMKGVYGTECMITLTYVERYGPKWCPVFYLLVACHIKVTPLCYFTVVWI